MSVAIRYPLHGEPLPREASSRQPWLATTLAWARGRLRTRKRAPAERKANSVFHRWAAADLAYRDVANPFLHGPVPR